LLVSFVVHVASSPAVVSLSLHDALPISGLCLVAVALFPGVLLLEAVPPLVVSSRGVVPLPAVAPLAVVSFLGVPSPAVEAAPPRSEEHTSELQSRENLVCRLLLEKKKTT